MELLNGNSLELIKNIPDESIDLVLTDPPYGINYGNLEWDKINFNTFTEQWLSECYRVLKPTGTMWSFMSHLNVINFITIQNKIKLNVHLDNWVIWCRSKGRMSSKHLKSTREDIIHSTKSNKFTWNNLQMLREVIAPYMLDGKPRGWFVDETGKRVRWTGLGNVWTYTPPFHKFKDDMALGHPHQKPLMMIDRLLLLSSNENDVVLDPFMGTGTTGVSCKKYNRQYIGIEQNEEYFNIATKRLEIA